MSKTIIISPSGNFYGSEQVLWDFLFNTKKKYTVFVPQKSLLLRKLAEEEHVHQVKSFDRARLPLFYCRILFSLLLGGVRTVYVNEAGHSKFILLLSGFFPRKNFIIHVRMLEDTQAGRWGRKIRENTRAISISQYIREQLPEPSELIYDPYGFTERKGTPAKIDAGRLVVGIIGRITATKGLPRLLELSEYLRTFSPGRFVFHLYGGLSDKQEDQDVITKLMTLPDVVVKGFRENKDEIYNEIDCVAHLNTEEALGRIFFEAIDYGKPFLGFTAGGIAEVGRLTGLEELLVAPGEGWKEELAARLDKLDREYAELAGRVIRAKKDAADLFTIGNYIQKVEKLIDR